MLITIIKSTIYCNPFINYFIVKKPAKCKPDNACDDCSNPRTRGDSQYNCYCDKSYSNNCYRFLPPVSTTPMFQVAIHNEISFPKGAINISLVQRL